MGDFDYLLLDKWPTDQLTDLRETERNHKNYPICDAIRDVLDGRGSFVIDTADGQVIYHMGTDWAGKRKEFLKNIVEIDLKFRK